MVKMALELKINGGSAINPVSFEVVSIITHQFGDFKAQIFDPNKTTFNTLAFKQDIEILVGTTPIFKGFLEKFEWKENITYIEGRSYATLLFARRASKSYTSQTASAILSDLITTYIPEISTAGIQSTAQTLTRNYIGDVIGKIAERLANLEGYQWYVDENKVFHFEPKGYPTSSVSLDYATTNGFLDYKFLTEGTRVKNQIHVYGKPKQPDGTGGIYAVVRDGDSISKYGVIEAEIVDPSISSVDEAIERAEEELARSKKVLQRGTLLLKGRSDIKAGEIITLSIDELGISNASYLVLSVKHTYKPHFTELSIAELSIDVLDILAEEIARMSQIDARDKDTSVTATKVEKIIEDVQVTAQLTIEKRTVSGATQIESNFIVETSKIEQIPTTTWTTLQVVNMTVVNGGLDLIRDRFAQLGTPGSQPTHIAVGTDNTPVSPTDTALGTEIARKAFDSGYPLASGTGSVDVRVSFTSAEAVGTLKEVGVFNASTGGTLVSRAVISDLPKSSSEELRLTVRFTFTNA